MNYTHRVQRSTTVNTYFQPSGNTSPGEYKSIEMAEKGLVDRMGINGKSRDDTDALARMQVSHLEMKRVTALRIFLKKYLCLIAQTVFVMPRCPCVPSE